MCTMYTVFHCSTYLNAGKSILCTVVDTDTIRQSKSFSSATQETLTKFMLSINFHFFSSSVCLPEETYNDVYPDQKQTKP